MPWSLPLEWLFGARAWQVVAVAKRSCRGCRPHLKRGGTIMVVFSGSGTRLGGDMKLASMLLGGHRSDGLHLRY